MESYWLLKTEPDDYSWNDLLQEKEAVWDGVKAPAAIKNIKQMKVGDLVFIYHTGKGRRIVGIAEVTSLPYLNPDNGGLEFKIKPVKELLEKVTLKQIKESGFFQDWDLVRLPRLSVMPVNKQQWDLIIDWPEQRKIQ